MAGQAVHESDTNIRMDRSHIPGWRAMYQKQPTLLHISIRLKPVGTDIAIVTSIKTHLERARLARVQMRAVNPNGIASFAVKEIGYNLNRFQMISRVILDFTHNMKVIRTTNK